jgi:membrane protein YdbS with pleckstrin-like domain
MRARSFVSVLLIIWLVIGAVAAAQRGYFAGPPASCASVGTIIVTIVTGPLNYTGVNPKVACEIPKPSP